MNISIAMCTYNGSRFVQQQLDSIASQTCLPAELVVCDDCSDDGTPDILQRFAAKAPFTVKVVRNTRTLGSTKNFEQAIQLCRGDAIALCDQDDVWYKPKLATLSKVLESEPGVGGVFSDASLINESAMGIGESLWASLHLTASMVEALEDRSLILAILLERSVVTGTTLLFRAELVPQVIPIPPECVHDAWITFQIAAQARLRAIPEKLIAYRLHSSQQIGIRKVSWHDRIKNQFRPETNHDELFLRRLDAMMRVLVTIPIEHRIRQRAEDRLLFLRSRMLLKEYGLVGRAVVASRTLPAYRRFANGLYSYLSDVFLAN